MKLNVAYFELFHCGFHEDYSIHPKKYGGGPIFARWAKEKWAKDNPDFQLTIFAPRGCWNHISEEQEQKACFVDLPLEICKALRQGLNVKEVIPRIDEFDIILHGHTGLAINNTDCSAIQVHWSGFGRASDGHPFIPWTLVYGKDMTPHFPNQKTLPIVIGKPVPKTFKSNDKSDFIFQCSRHDEGIDTIQVVKECNKHGIRGVFAGPINGDYSLLDHIDNKNTFYLGQISEAEKLFYTKRARLSTMVCPFGENFNQSVVECLAHGTPILRKEIKKTDDPTFNNWLKDYIIDGENGVVWDGANFLDCWNKSADIDQYKCWKSAQKYSSDAMVESFEEALKNVMRDRGYKT